MTYISIDTENKQSKSFLAFVETLPFATIIKEPNPATVKAIEAAKSGKATKHKNSKSLIEFLNK